MYDKDGLQYFMHITTLNNDTNKQFMLLNNDIRKIIWIFSNIDRLNEHHICETMWYF